MQKQDQNLQRKKRVIFNWSFLEEGRDIYYNRQPMGDYCARFCRPLSSCLGCLFCDCLCCECNCLIFPAPRSSSLPEDTPIHEHLVSTSFHSFEQVSLSRFRTDKSFPSQRSPLARAEPHPNVSSTSTATHKTSV